MIYTIGHSTLPPAAFLQVARRMAPGLPHVIMDVRSHPTSKWEWFRIEQLRQWLPDHGFTYRWEPRLGGWDVRHAGLALVMARHGVNLNPYLRGAFPKQQIAASTPPADRPAWTNRGLFDYSWFTALKEFNDAAHELIDFGSRHQVAIMCAEVLWWKCHRSMIADWLVAHDVDAIHLQPRETKHATVIGDRLQRYDRQVYAAWFGTGQI